MLAVLAVPLVGDDHGHRIVCAGPDRGEADAAAVTLQRRAKSAMLIYSVY